MLYFKRLLKVFTFNDFLKLIALFLLVTYLTLVYIGVKNDYRKSGIVESCINSGGLYSREEVCYTKGPVINLNESKK